MHPFERTAGAYQTRPAPNRNRTKSQNASYQPKPADKANDPPQVAVVPSFEHIQNITSPKSAFDSYPMQRPVPQSQFTNSDQKTGSEQETFQQQSEMTHKSQPPAKKINIRKHQIKFTQNMEDSGGKESILTKGDSLPTV